MSGPAYVVMPLESGDGQHRQEDTEKITAALRQSLYEQQHPEHEQKEEHHGPLKELLAHQDSLYQYISWEHPVTTLFSYVVALSVLLGMHYVPLTRFGLKYGAVILGVISLTELASRSFGPNTFLARLRPKPYKTVPESTLNATLKDIHDFVQYAVVQAQRVLYGEDLDKTFLAFFIFTAMYWLAKIVSPFGWSILGLTSLYVAPLVLSPRGHAVGNAALSLSGDLANAAVAEGRVLAQDTGARVGGQYARVQGAAKDTGRRVGDMVGDGKHHAADLVEGGKQRAGHMVENGRHVAGDLSNRAKNVVGKKSPGDAAGRGTETVGSATGSLHVDDNQHWQHLNAGVVDRTPGANNVGNDGGYRTAEKSNVVERNPLH